jgi:hypothetical protein
MILILSNNKDSVIDTVEGQIAGPRPYVTQAEDVKADSNNNTTNTRLTQARHVTIGKRT